MERLKFINELIMKNYQDEIKDDAQFKKIIDLILTISSSSISNDLEITATMDSIKQFI